MFEDDLARIAERFSWSEEAVDATRALLERARSSGTLSDTFLDLDTLGPADDPTEELRPDIPAPPSRYEVLAALGHGGMGTVHRVRDRDLNCTLAMKVIRPGLVSRSASVSRFVGEAQATAQLQHPAIPSIHELGRLPDGRHYYTMTEVRGQTLSELIAALHEASSGHGWGTTDDGFTLRRVVDVLATVCDAVGYAHSRGVVHRDLKPDNVMIGDFGEVRVLDWGIAKILGAPQDATEGDVQTRRSTDDAQTTVAGAVTGTPAYMAPEQAMGQVDAISPRTDVWSLGAMLFELLEGQPPFQGTSAMDVVLRVLEGDLPEPSRVDTSDGLEPTDTTWEDDDEYEGQPAAPRDLVQIWRRAMARDPADRYADGRELGRALAAWRDGAMRRARALDVVAGALARASEAVRLRREASSLRAEARALWDGVEPFEGEDRKRPAWEREDEASRRERAAEHIELQVVRALHGALTHAPDLPQAHAALAEHYRAEHAAAEAERRDVDRARAEALLNDHAAALPQGHPDRTRHARYLRGHGALTLHTDPPGAIATLYRFRTKWRRLVPELVEEVGPTPLERVALPIGSYVVELSAPGRATVRYPVQIDRLQHWDGVPPGGSEPEPIHLPAEGELGPDDCYVPAGWFLAGGDPLAPMPRPARRVWVDAFAVGRFQVTNQQYLAFLDDLVAQGREEEAVRFAPQEPRASTDAQRSLLYGRSASGGFALVPDSDGDVWDPEYPVFMVDWFGAAAYARWLAERTGRPWRLPAELEWEKAARGVDGRLYPWGDVFDPSWACTDDSHAGRRLPSVVQGFPADCSPYGARGMAGNVQEWCAGPCEQGGPPMSEGRAETSFAEPDTPVCRVAVRAGAWTTGPSSTRAAARFAAAARLRTWFRGFRVVCPISSPTPS